MKRLRHKVKINVADRNGKKVDVVTGTTMKLPHRILRFLFGEMSELMLITPGRTVEGIEIKEVGGEKTDETL